MKKRVILLVLIFLNLGVIFFFSHQTSEVSGKLSSGITSQIKVHTPHYAEKTQAQQKVVHTQVQYAIRGLAHGCLFFSLGVLSLLLWKTFSCKWYVMIMSNVLLGFLVALSDEIHQLFVPGRSFGWDDILYDSIGFLTGMVIVMLFTLINRLYKKRTESK